jgi:murein DD-endopeptidase MepM/ murein hydrolase activator NlpD
MRELGRSPRHSRAFGARKLVASAVAAVLLSGCAETLVESTIREVPGSTIREFTVGGCAAMSWPVEGLVSSGFGVRDGRPHDGIDLAVPEGTPVRAACDGVVAYAGDRLRGYGRLLIVGHAGHLATIYAHNRALEVKEGDPVARGQVIARSGATGHVTAPHLHFEVRRDNHPDDPLKYLPGRVAARFKPPGRPWTNESPR